MDFNDFAPATLLVVDDNPTNRAYMAGIFEKTHHRVHFATNGQEALACLEKTKPDVVLLDIRMPVMDGRTALAEIRKQASLVSLPVIAVTASSKAGEEMELQSQFSGYIRKPFSRQTLFVALAQFLQRASPGNGLEGQNLGQTLKSIPIPSPDQAAQWQELALELRRQEATEWPTLRDSLAVNETRAFAHKLFLLGQAAQCGPLATYAAALTTFADAYAIGQMERHLAAFPKLVESIEASSAQSQLQASMKVQMNAPLIETNTGCLLVVDDQESNIQVVGAALGKLGFEILPATGGLQAFQRLAVRRPDLILLDLLMPEMDGFEVCRRIRENPDWAEIPIIFLSSADDKGLIVRALESGGVDYITKPFNHAELVTRVRTHLALKRARDELKQLAEDRDELLGILTHDLKNHLGGMDMSAQLLRDRTEAMADPKLRLMAENISHSSSQMLAFVKEFLANASADHGLNLKTEPVNLSDAAARAVQQHQEAAKRKQLVLKVVLPPSNGMLVQADGAALNQVLDNLLSNAIKFSPPGKQIRLTVCPPGAGYVECQVQDEGPGFSENDKTRMFRRYGRLSARPTGGEPSTGLGLSIVKKLVLAMHGELACESTPGNGATFAFRLPRAATPH